MNYRLIGAEGSFQDYLRGGFRLPLEVPGNPSRHGASNPGTVSKTRFPKHLPDLVRCMLPRLGR